jgi:hypothetical protein
MEQSSAPMRTRAVSRVLADGRIVELIHDRSEGKTRFAIHEGGVTVFADELPISSSEVLVPVPAANSLIRHNAVLLPERPEPYGDSHALVAEIEAYITRYVAVSDWFRHLAAYYVLFSWVYDAFEELPYLRVQAEYGSGKTRALLIIGSLCYRAFFASGASTVSPIFHTLDTFRGTLILDEADFRFSDQTSELVKILNNGHVRGFPVFRTAITLKREFDPRAFEVYGPKFVAMRKSFSDDALESRFLTERMDGISVPPHVPINLPKAQREEAQVLQNKLLQYRLDYRHQVKIQASLVDPSLSPRSNQILVPLLSIIPDAAVRSEIKQAVVLLEEERQAARTATVEADLLAIIAGLATGASPIAVADICAQFIERHQADYERPITARYIGSLLRGRLGLSTYKRHGVYVVAADAARLAPLYKRYNIVSAETIGANSVFNKAP